MTTTEIEAPTFEDLTGYRPAHNGWSADGVFGSSGAHGQVQRDLARWLRAAGYLIFTEVQLPNQSTRADVVAVKPHVYTRKDLRLYEVKATRADFLREMASGKWQAVAPCFNRVVFAFPASVATPGEVPPECGVAIKGPNGWHHVRNGRATGRTKLTVEDVLALLYRGYEEHGQARDLRAILASGRGAPDGMDDVYAAAKRAGRDLAMILKRTTPPLGAELARLRAVMEKALGVDLSTEWKVENETGRIERFLAVLAEWEEHGRTLQIIGQYLAALPWRQIDHERTRVEEALKEAKYGQ